MSFTHLISYAIVRALEAFPGLNDAYAEQDGQPGRLVRKTVNIGIAVSVEGKDGGSSLVVPNLKNAGEMSFAEYMAAFDDTVARARKGKLQLPDFQGTTISLTNPGTVGTFASNPRLMAGQGAIIATGAMAYPPEFANTPEDTIRQLRLSRVMMIGCTYDHRIIQGADSGRFLARIEELLAGGDHFYADIYDELGVDAQRASLEAPTIPLAGPGRITASAADIAREANAAVLINTWRRRGHLLADIDPLGSRGKGNAALEPEFFGLTEEDMDIPLVTQGGRTLRQVLEWLRECYSSTIGAEFMYIEFPDERDWLREQMETPRSHWNLGRAKRLQTLNLLLEAEQFEHFLHTRFIGKKRFSLEGGESAILLLDEVLERGANDDAVEAVIGMAHRGRLTVLANIIGKPLHEVFAEFEEAPDSTQHRYGSGDVKYHLGSTGKRTFGEGKEILVSMAFNPSHLEAVDPVVEGLVRPRQEQLKDRRRARVLPILVHGDAAFSGQGVVPETLNLSQLEGYHTGGTFHIVINNQLGFTTSPEEGRSSTYATDVAHTVQAPIFHVNGDDPEAVLRVAQICYEFRQMFHRDVVIDLLCYRRHGHNEGDDPNYTQPTMYKKIRQHPSVFKIYSDRLIEQGLTTKVEIADRTKAFVRRMSDAFDQAKKNSDTYELTEVAVASAEPVVCPTAITQEMAEKVIEGITTFPADFHLHPKLKGFVDRRREALTGGPIDWALGEAMAFGSLVADGTPVRLSGQDVGRGTFSQRHTEYFDYEDGHLYIPLKNIAPDQARFEVVDSPLSEYAVMGFEFGYSLGDPETLVMWEAQFGDFVNGAAIVIDQFLSSAETKWGQPSGLVLLLPHGYEGQGPEHSSARIERFLQLCAENNMQVANCTTPAQYFHILRRQPRGADGKPLRKPLIIFTPKSILRHPQAVSTLDDLLHGQFMPVLPDEGDLEPAKVTRILFCSGKVYYDLAAARESNGAKHVAIVRVEQMYPFPKTAVQNVLATYPAANEIFWVQEEPSNMGPWWYMKEQLSGVLQETKRVLQYAGRPESAATASGSLKRHEQEQRELAADAFAPKPVIRKPRRMKAVRKKK